jgi:spermidine synthase
VPDIAFVEEFSHIPLLAHPRPKTVLVLGHGAGGVLNECLKHPTVTRIDYVEIDALLLKAIEQFRTPLIDTELKDSRVHLHFTDGREFLKNPPAAYDVVLLGFPPPYTLQQNRFFTEEFFVSIRKSLNRDGIVALTMTGSLAYYSAELKALNLCMMKTLDAVFPSLFVVPGDVNLFMASKSATVSLLSPALLSGRLAERGIKTALITETHLSYRLDPEKRKWLNTSLQGGDTAPNRDFSPKALFYNIAYQNLLFSPYLAGLFTAVNNLRPYHVALFSIVVLLLSFALSRKYPRLPLVYAIGATGFAAMLAELILLFSFQIFYGYIFYEIGVLLTLFMGGMAVGSLATFSRFIRRRPPLLVLKATEACLVIFTLILALIFHLSRLPSFSTGIPFYPVLLSFLFISGVLAGAEFPLATMSHTAHILPGPQRDISLGPSVGILYGADLMGGWIGGLTGGFLLLPVLGLPGSCLLLAGLKAGSLLLLLTSHKK